MDTPRLDRTQIAVFRLGEEPQNYVFWLSQTPAQRLSAIEFYRLQSQNYATQSRLQRVYRVTQRQKS